MRAFMLAGVLGIAAVIGAIPAAASPVSYLFSSGQVTLYAASSGSAVSAPANVALSGVQVTVDETALTLPSLAFAVGSTGTMAVNYGTFTSFNLDFASVIGTGGTLSLVDVGPPVEYGFNMTMNLAGQFDASPPSYVNAPFAIPGAQGTGSIFIDGNDLILSSITIGAVDPDGPSGPLAPLLIKGDFIFVGTVPEPGTALLLGAGLASVAAGTRRRAIVRQ